MNNVSSTLLQMRIDAMFSADPAVRDAQQDTTLKAFCRSGSIINLGLRGGANVGKVLPNQPVKCLNVAVCIDWPRGITENCVSVPFTRTSTLSSCIMEALRLRFPSGSKNAAACARLSPSQLSVSFNRSNFSLDGWDETIAALHLSDHSRICVMFYANDMVACGGTYRIEG